MGRFSPGVGWLAYSRINPYERRATVDSVFLARYERDSVSTGSSESIKREWSRGCACGGAKTTFPHCKKIRLVTWLVTNDRLVIELRR